jgi:glycosyltransferase involved in cell wall biosynthesis
VRTKAVVAQKGAREHFLAARALHHRGALARLVVDWYAPGGLLGTIALALGRSARSALAARADGIPSELIRPLRGLGFWCKWQERAGTRNGRAYEAFDKTDAAFARAVARIDLPDHDVFFGYSYASLEAIQVEKQRGRLTILDQIDPGPVESRLVAEEMACHPDLAGPPESFPANHYSRAKREWDFADVIIVNSEWTRDAITAEGADSSKIELLPLAYELPSVSRPLTSDLRSLTSGPLKVLWLGQVNVRKGIHYLLEAARKLEREPIEFVIAGPVQIRREIEAAAPRNARWLGSVPRSQASELYLNSEVFVLPTLSDGFAITQLEALAHGLPVIATPNCGRVVEDGITGFIIPPRDARALADAILKFTRNRNLAREMSARCLKAAKIYSIGAYGRRLIEIIETHMARRSTGISGSRAAVL